MPGSYRRNGACFLDLNKKKVVGAKINFYISTKRDSLAAALP